mmetsp:Transcript_2252/g.8822  ORF Transcript_2252/g.8822 Transcript_2252/m.8822 type:complete len:238 (-) Transcript_2252:2205-2918(-)
MVILEAMINIRMNQSNRLSSAIAKHALRTGCDGLNNPKKLLCSNLVSGTLLSAPGCFFCMSFGLIMTLVVSALLSSSIIFLARCNLKFSTLAAAFLFSLFSNSWAKCANLVAVWDGSLFALSFDSRLRTLSDLVIRIPANTPKILCFFAALLSSSCSCRTSLRLSKLLSKMAMSELRMIKSPRMRTTTKYRRATFAVVNMVSYITNGQSSCVMTCTTVRIALLKVSKFDRGFGSILQ